MTREEAKQILPFIKAFSEGKDIEGKDFKGAWNILLDPCFSGGADNYRIKPEPKYRPFKNAEECWNEMLKHQPFGWIKDKEDGSMILLTCIEEDGDISVNGNTGWDYKGVMQNYTFADGKPFGIK